MYQIRGKSGREIWIDACRGLGMLLVLLGHNQPPFVRWIYGFHMPLFYILSGYLFKRSHTERSIREEAGILCLRYILPYPVLAAVNLLIHTLHIMYVTPDHRFPFDRLREFIKGLILVYGPGREFCFPLWFLPSIAMALMLFYLIRRCSLLWVRIAAFALSLAAAWIFFANGRDLPFALHTIPIAVIFLEAGYLLRQLHLPERAADRFAVLTFIAAASFGSAAVLFNPVERVDICLSNLGFVPLMLSGAVLLSFALMLGCCGIGKVAPAVLKPAAFIGKHTIFLLAFDIASNDLGGTILKNFASEWPWYVSFLTRCLVLIVLFLIWQLLIHLIPSERIRKLVDY